MTARITAIAVDASDPPALAAFWAEVLGWAVLEEDEGVVSIGPASGSAAPALDFLPTPDPTPGKRRLHLDVNATDRDQAAELERLLALGATRADVGQGDDVSWVVLADPEGNEFCLLASRVAPLPDDHGPAGGEPRRAAPPGP